MNDFDRFAPYYDLEFAGFRDDLEIYRGYAERAGSPLLELACGTGRLVVPLAAAGYRITGVDIAPAMLAQAQQSVAAAGLGGSVRLLEDDIRSLETLAGQSFRLIFCAINSFLHLLDQPSQLAALRAAHRCLDPGGWLLLDIFNPHPDTLAHYDGRLVHEESFIEPTTGARIDKFVSRTLDAVNQTIHTTFFYDRIEPDGRVHRTAAPFSLRYIHRYELGLLLEAAGFVLEDLLADYTLRPVEAETIQMIAVARPRTSAR